ncbi:hypothetical protein BDZ97DRAFT_1785797 [Flammula alnicola]|nr:hypothetical protein BDZ97DRAFT_1785797 [Flammula alnicola]
MFYAERFDDAYHVRGIASFAIAILFGLIHLHPHHHRPACFVGSIISSCHLC